MPVKRVAKKVVKSVKETHEESAFDIHTSTAAPVPQTSSRNRIKVIIGISFTTIVIVITILNYFFQFHAKQNLQKNPVVASEHEQESIVAKIGKLIQLPASETPTIATVSDLTKLQGQPFFQKAKDGDIVLIYSKADEAVLYDPNADKILQVGTITNQAVAGASTSVNQTQAGVSLTPASVTVALYNGTTIDGLTKKIQAELVQAMPSATVVQNTNASNQNYTNTTVVDLTGKESAAAQQLATILHGTVGGLPAGETASANADIVIILGKTN